MTANRTATTTAHRPTLFVVLTSLALLLVPASSAQDLPPGAISVSVTFDGTMPADGIDLPVEVTVDCTVVSGGLPSPTIDLTLDDGPSWLNATAGEISIEPNECAGQTSVTKSGTLPLDAADDAPGLSTETIRVKATLGQRSATETLDLMIDYEPGYQIDPDGDQTFDVTNETYTFNMTITLTANAQTMVMFERLNVEQGSISGLNANTYDVLAGETGETRTITFTAPDGDWEQANVTFYTYGHCRVDSYTGDCPPEDERNITWTFVNQMAPSGDDGEGPDTEPEESPIAAPVSLVLVGLAAVALLRQRRH